MKERKVIKNWTVKPVVSDKKDPNKILGGDLFTLSANIFISSKKRAGKSTVVYNIAKRVSNKFTNVVIISPSYRKDGTYIELIKELKKKGCEVSCFPSFIATDGSNILSELVNQLEEGEDGEKKESQTSSEHAELEEEPEKVEEIKDINGFGIPPFRKVPIISYNFNENPAEDVQVGKGDNDIKEKKVKKKKPKKYKGKQACKWLVILDDLSNLMRSKELVNLAHIIYHHDMKLVCVSHFITDVLPAYRSSIDYGIILKGFQDERLEMLFKALNLSNITFDEFVKIYKWATKEKYQFLFIDVLKELYRKNFDTELTLE